MLYAFMSRGLCSSSDGGEPDASLAQPAPSWTPSQKGSRGTRAYAVVIDPVLQLTC